MKIFKKTEKHEDLRKNVYLPIIEDQKEMQKFAEQLTKIIISLFGTGGEHDEYRKQETEMLYHAIVLLMSSPKAKHLKAAIHCYLSPEYVKRNMQPYYRRYIRILATSSSKVYERAKGYSQLASSFLYKCRLSDWLRRGARFL